MADIKITPTALTGKLSAKISPEQLTIQQASVKSTPQSLSNIPRAVTLRGEVQTQNNDGTTQIKTQHGTVTLQLEKPLPRGQRIDIQISSGSPPREAIVQTATPRAQPQKTPPPAQQQTQQQPTQANSTQPAPQPSKPAASENIDAVRNLQTTAKQATENIANTVRQSIDPNAIGKPQTNTQNVPTQTPTNANPLNAGQAVRLTLLPPNLQNPTALGQFANTSTTPQSTIQILPTGIGTAPLLGQGNATALSPTAGSNLLFQQTSLSLPSTGSSQTVLPQFNAPTTGLPLNLNTATALIPQPSLLNASPQTSITDARIVSIQTPSAITTTPTTQTSAPSLQIGQILAQSTGTTTPTGNPILQIQPSATGAIITANPPLQIAPMVTPQLFALNYPATNLPKGTQIILQPTPNITNAPIITPPQTWPVLENALELLLSQLSVTHGQSLLNTIPRPASAGFQFTAAAMIFIAATRGGDIAGWMGGRADSALKGGSDKDNLASRLFRDITANTGRAAGTDAPPSIQNSPDWRGHTLPLLFGMEITKMNLWTKSLDDEESNNGGEQTGGMRFIVDLNMSRMGNVQLDGLIQPYAKRLDLALKTEQEFGSNSRTHIRGLWHRALSQIDMGGELDFQST